MNSNKYLYEDKSIKINRVAYGIIAQFFTIKCGQCNN